MLDPKDVFGQILADGLKLQGRDPYRIDFEKEPTIDFMGNPKPLHEGQKKVWYSKKRHVAAIAGRQSGKTALLPYLALREIQRCGGGDGLIVGPTFPLMDRRLVPECERVWKTKYGLGEYITGKRMFRFSPEGLRKLGVTEACVYFGFAEDPESLESMQAMWCARDETGQSKFSRAAAEAIDGRLTVAQSLGFGRIFDSTTPYAAGGDWFQEDVWNQRDINPDLEVVSYKSTDNPSFSQAVFDELRGKLPAWKFSMMYEGQYTRPAGAVYDNFDRKLHVVPRYVVPPHWRRYYGVDFGQVHTAVVCAAEHPEMKDSEGNPVLVVYHEHFPNKASYTYQHVQALRSAEDAIEAEYRALDPEYKGTRGPIRGVGGARGEKDPRTEWSASGVNVEEPWIKDVESGIDRTYACLSRGGLLVMDHCVGTIGNLEGYSWELDDSGETVPGKIKNKNSWHYADAVRYLCSQLRPNRLEEPTLTRTMWFGEAQKTSGQDEDWDEALAAVERSHQLRRRLPQQTAQDDWGQ